MPSPLVACIGRFLGGVPVHAIGASTESAANALNVVAEIQHLECFSPQWPAPVHRFAGVVSAAGSERDA